jgi:hypothetical protein
MKKGDRVYVNWPTGKGGPYEINDDLHTGYVLKVNREWCEIPQSWCEPAEPEIEEGRLYYTGKEKRMALVKSFYDDGAWDHLENIEPVHRRWDDLSGPEKYELNSVVKNDEDPNNVKTIFCYIYKLITGEDHP